MTARTAQPKRLRTVLRTELARERRALRRAGIDIPEESILGFASPHSQRLRVLPGVRSDARRVQWVLEAVRRSGVGPYLFERLRMHKGTPCSYDPEMLCVGAVLSVMNDWTLEVTDITQALASIAPITRARLGLRDADGYFIGYRSVDHQFRRLIEALDKGWTAADGTVCDLHWLMDRIVTASIPERSIEVTDIAIDGLAVETCARIIPGSKRGPDPADKSDVSPVVAAEDLVDEARKVGKVETDDITATARATSTAVKPPRRKSGRRTKTKKGSSAKAAKPRWPVGPDGRSVPTKDLDARLGKRTVTQRQRDEHYVGYEEHLATRVRSIYWRGRAAELGIGPAVVNFIVGVRVAPALEARGRHGSDLIAAVKQTYEELRRAAADMGYTPQLPSSFANPIRSVGVHLVQDYTTFQRNAKVEPLTITLPDGDRVTLLPIAGGFFHEYMPAEYWENPRLPKRWEEDYDKDVYKALEAYYNERTAYLWRIHSYGPDGSVRLKCPACDGRLRPLDLTEAANTGKIEMPALDVPEGVTRCCPGKIVTVPADMLPREFQPIPYGTRAWRKAFGQRSLVEGSNSLLQTGLARQTRGFFRVFGLAKVSFLLTMAAAAINLLMYEKVWQETRVEVLAHDGSDPSEVDDGYLDHFAACDDPGVDVFTVLSPPAPP